MGVVYVFVGVFGRVVCLFVNVLKHIGDFSYERRSRDERVIVFKNRPSAPIKGLEYLHTLLAFDQRETRSRAISCVQPREEQQHYDKQTQRNVATNIQPKRKRHRGRWWRR